jgi:hypothetical protein
MIHIRPRWYLNPMPKPYMKIFVKEHLHLRLETEASLYPIYLDSSMRQSGPDLMTVKTYASLLG